MKNTKETKCFKHLTETQRVTIANYLARGSKLVKIGLYAGVNPTSVSKEIKRNRYVRTEDEGKLDDCKYIKKFPYVCNGCAQRYSCYKHRRYFYDPHVAQKYADTKLVVSRTGLDMDPIEFKAMDNIIKKGVELEQSIYHIVQENKDKIKKNPSTIYRYINKEYLTTKRIDLPKAITYKKRKHQKKYDYSFINRNIDRSNRTYIDYLSYLFEHPREFGWEIDYLGVIREDSKSILTLVLPDLQFGLAHLFNYRSNYSLVAYLNRLEKALGIEDFKKVFPWLLGDRDPAFNDYMKIEFSEETGEKRTHIFFCDPYVSSQKGHIENMNKQLRTYFPKGESIDYLTPKVVREINEKLNTRHLKSLNGLTAKEAFIKIYGERIYNILLKTE